MCQCCYLTSFQFNRVVEGGLAAAAVLISLGALLGKLNPFQILMLSVIEAPIFVLNSHLGYTILGVADVGNISRFALLCVFLSWRELDHLHPIK